MLVIFLTFYNLGNLTPLTPDIGELTLSYYDATNNEGIQSML